MKKTRQRKEKKRKEKFERPKKQKLLDPTQLCTRYPPPDKQLEREREREE
jgi:hypothetical protein